MNSGYLVIAEKNSVAKSIAYYLAESKVATKSTYGVPTYWFTREGATWVSVGLRGHLMEFDFDKKYNIWVSSKISELFREEPMLIIKPDSVKYAKAIAYLSRRLSNVILALDSDVEGEAIAFEAMMIINNANPAARFSRALFSAVTKSDIINAFNNLVSPNPNYAKKVFTRMKLDLKLGAAFTRFLTLSAKDGGAELQGKRVLSYGPCQTPVLGLVVKRALERENFKPTPYYIVEATVDVDGEELKLSTDKIDDLDKATQIRDAVIKARFLHVVESIGEKTRVSPPKPLETIELERRASRFLNIRAKNALDIAEDLYRYGFISYPRTETNIYPRTLNLSKIVKELTRVKDYEAYANSLLASEFTPTSGGSTDNAHPPIHPTRGANAWDVTRVFGKESHWRIYDLIARHFLATLSKPAIIERQRIIAKLDDAEFKATGLVILSKGYLEIYPFETPRENPLPISKVKAGSKLRVLGAEVIKKKTQPPPYLSEAELLRLMKQYGIGTDATMQDHIHTNIERKYFTIIKKQCVPTQLGKAVVSILDENANELVDPLFRSKMESKLATIGEGKTEPTVIDEEITKEASGIYEKIQPRYMDIGSKLATILRGKSRENGANERGRKTTKY